MRALAVLFGALFTVAVSIAAGRMVLRRAAPGLYRDEQLALSFVAGSALLSSLVFLLCTARLAYPLLFLAAGAAILAVAWRDGALRLDGARFPALSRLERWISAPVFAVFTALYFLTAMAPECSADGASYHLSFVARYLREHSFVVLPYNMYAQLSQGIELLFTFAFAFGRHSAAALVHYAYLLALTLLIASYGRRMGHPGAGLAAALIVYTSPVVGMDATSAYVDAAVGAIIFAVFYLLSIWDEKRLPAMLPVIGLVAGFGYAAKYTALLAVPYAVGFVLWRSRRWRPAAWVGLWAVPMVAPWMLKNLLVTGNPLSPMANRWFPNSFVSIDFEKIWTAKLRVYDLVRFQDLPWQLTVRGEGIPGIIGPVFLLAPLALLALRTAPGRRLMFAAALYTVPYFANIGARFLIPALPFVALALGIALASWPRVLATLVLSASVLNWPWVMRTYAAQHVWGLEPRFPLKAALRIESEDHWLGRKHGEYIITRVIESQTPPGARIFTFAARPEAYTSRELAVFFQSARGETAGDIFLNATTQDYQCRLRQSLTFASQAVRKLRIVVARAAPRPDEDWNIHEVRLFSEGKEIPRSPEWRITARPNPWDSALAFDNSIVTRWRAREPLRANQFIEIDLFRPLTLDTVTLDTSVGQTGREFRVEALAENGQWRVVSEKTRESALEHPGFQGPAVVAELKARGFDYLLLDADNFSGENVVDDPSAWGLTEVGRYSNEILYRIDVQGPTLLKSAKEGS